MPHFGLDGYVDDDAADPFPPAEKARLVAALNARLGTAHTVRAIEMAVVSRLTSWADLAADADDPAG